MHEVTDDVDGEPTEQLKLKEATEAERHEKSRGSNQKNLRRKIQITQDEHESKDKKYKQDRSTRSAEVNEEEMCSGRET